MAALLALRPMTTAVRGKFWRGLVSMLFLRRLNWPIEASHGLLDASLMYRHFFIFDVTKAIGPIDFLVSRPSGQRQV
jgi:hypothetical protein